MGNRRISTTLLISICIIATFFLGYTEILVIRPNGNDKETLLEIKALVEKQNKEILELKAQLANPSSPSSFSSSSSSSSSASELKPANHAISTPPTTSPTSTPVTRDLHPVLDFEDLPYLVGPRNGDINTSRTLVTICIGKSDKAMINKLITTYFQPYNLSAPHPESPFTFLLFHYDNADYSEFPWYNQLNVVAIRVLHKMKYWYLKRFLTPDIARSFQNIIILDGDVDFEAPFDPLQYLRVANAFNISMSQPAHFQATTSLHNGIKVKEGSQIGRYRDFIECGPAVFVSSAAYQCIWELLQPDLTSGWGLDVIWVDYLRSVCGYSDKSVAIFDAFVLIHETPSSQGTASSNPGFNSKAINELTAYNARFPQLKQSWGSLVQEGAPFGDKKCLKSEDPVRCS